MTFFILLLLLSGLALVTSGLQHQSLKTFLQGWIGTGGTSG